MRCADVARRVEPETRAPQRDHVGVGGGEPPRHRHQVRLAVHPTEPLFVQLAHRRHDPADGLDGTVGQRGHHWLLVAVGEEPTPQPEPSGAHHLRVTGSGLFRGHAECGCGLDRGDLGKSSQHTALLGGLDALGDTRRVLCDADREGLQVVDHELLVGQEPLGLLRRVEVQRPVQALDEQLGVLRQLREPIHHTREGDVCLPVAVLSLGFAERRDQRHQSRAHLRQHRRLQRAGHAELLVDPGELAVHDRACRCHLVQVVLPQVLLRAALAVRIVDPVDVAPLVKLLQQFRDRRTVDGAAGGLFEPFGHPLGDGRGGELEAEPRLLVDQDVEHYPVERRRLQPQVPDDRHPAGQHTRLSEHEDLRPCGFPRLHQLVVIVHSDVSTCCAALDTS